MDKTHPIRTFMHYTDPDRDRELTVFGCPRQGLFYNYDDRLPYEKYQEGVKLAKEKGAAKNSPLYFEIMLSHVHGVPCALEHVVLGCNRSNGDSYLIFGYTYPDCISQ